MYEENIECVKQLNVWATWKIWILNTVCAANTPGLQTVAAEGD